MRTIRRCHTGLIPKDELARILASMSPGLFAANYQLQHIATGEALFDATTATGAVQDFIGRIQNDAINLYQHPLDQLMYRKL